MERTPDPSPTRGKDAREVRQANRAMWNETADVHAALNLADLKRSFADPTFVQLDAIEKRALLDAGVVGADVVQLSCNNGRELLSVERLGAERCVGVDISEKFIAHARELAEVAGSRAEFLASDVYEIPDTYDASFDIAYVTIGALGWLPDLSRWYGVVSRLLRPGGRLVVYEMHPVLDMFDAQAGLEFRHSYFRTEPYVESESTDYYDTSAVIHQTSYWFHHKVSDLINGAIGAGLQIQRFDEFDHDISMVFRGFQEFDARPPLSYLLVARKVS